MLFAMTSSSGTYVTPSGKRTHRALLRGTLIRTKRVGPSFSCNRTASERLRFEMKGKGWLASTASGVSTGSMFSRKNALHQRFISGSISAHELKLMPRSRSIGMSLLLKQSDCLEMMSAISGRQAASCWRGVWPSAESVSSPMRTRSFRPPMRFMKNSSMFEPTIAVNFTRSSKGVRSSSASASTRLLN